MVKPAAPREGKPAHERTIEEFVGTDPSIDRAYGRWNEEAFILHRLPYLGSYTTKEFNIFCTEPQLYVTGAGRRKISHCFHVAVLDQDPGYALLLEDMIDADTGEYWGNEGVVGEFYRDGFGQNLLGIMEAYRGKGVGPHFVAAAIEATGNVEPSGAYSPAGLTTRRRAHQILVERALQRGDEVPENVLKEYGFVI